MTQSSNVMIEADNLVKSYGGAQAVQGITFACKPGEIVGFLGPNGAGKTTTMRILTGYMPPTEGDAYIAGYHTVDQSIEARQHLGYLPETVPLYNEMKVEDYLAFIGRLRRLENLWERIDDVLEDVDMLGRAESYIGTLSKGMRQRVGLAQALLHNPDVLILDEPTIGLDPRQIADVRRLIKALGERHTILLSTHILSEVEQICDRVIMIINGRIWADMPLKKAIGSETISLRLAAPSADAAEQLRKVKGVRSVSQNDKTFSLEFDGRDDTRAAVADTAVRAAWGLLELSAHTLSLESIFLDKLREAESVKLTAEETAAAESSAELTAESEQEATPDA